MWVRELGEGVDGGLRLDMPTGLTARMRMQPFSAHTHKISTCNFPRWSGDCAPTRSQDITVIANNI